MLEMLDMVHIHIWTVSKYNLILPLNPAVAFFLFAICCPVNLTFILLFYFFKNILRTFCFDVVNLSYRVVCYFSIMF